MATTTTTTERTVIPSPEHSTDYVRAWRASSKRHPHLTYIVTYDILANDWRCQCPGAFYRGHCVHIDQAIKALVAEWRAPRGKERAA